MSRRVATLLLLSALSLSAIGQQTAQTKPRGWREAEEPAVAKPTADQVTPTFQAQVDLVNVAFLVRDQSGALIKGLTKDDIELYENGVRQQIRNFAREETQLTVGLIIDRSGSQEGFEDDNQYAAIQFLKRVLREQDAAFLVGFGNRIRLLSGLTNDARKLERAIKFIEDIYDDSPRLGPAVSREGGSAVIDAVYWSAKETLMDVGGRKALIMIGDGKENSSKMRALNAVELLQAEDIIFYGLDNGGNENGRRRDRNRMPLLAEETGGRVFPVGQGSLKEALSEIELELRTLYTLGYISSNPDRDGKFRRIEIRPKNPQHLVRARSGYYAN